MIVVQSPLRISFFGGGTDFRGFFEQEGGCVLSSAIDKSIFVMIKKRFDRKLRVGYTRTEMVDQVDEINHELIREALKKVGILEGVEITTMGDIPSEGSGLGSSSTVTVGVLHALYSYLGENVSAKRLATEACEIEIDTLNKPIGVQDQYIAAYGGLRFMEFGPGPEVKCCKVEVEPEIIRQLEESLMLFFTGITRSAGTVLTEQSASMHDKLEILRRLREMARTARDRLIVGELEDFGGLLHESWMLKKQLASKISNGTIEAAYQAAIDAGASGGKITGAGGGGFLLFYCPQGKRQDVRRALNGLQELPIKLERDGAKVIFNYRRT